MGPAEVVCSSALMLARANLTARKAAYKNESSWLNRLSRFIRAFAMKTTLTINVKIDLAKVITALTGFALAMAHILQYI